MNFKRRIPKREILINVKMQGRLKEFVHDNLQKGLSHSEIALNISQICFPLSISERTLFAWIARWVNESKSAELIEDQTVERAEVLVVTQ